MSLVRGIAQPLTRGIGLAINRGALPSAFAELNLLAPALDSRISFTRASTKSYVGADGLLHTANVNECPLEYDPVTLLPVGRSFWEARTNSCLWSEDRSQWTTQQASLSAGSAFPLNPAKTMTRITANGDAAGIVATSVTAGTQYTVSAYVRRDQHRYVKLFGFGNGSTGCVVDLQTGATQINGSWDAVSVSMVSATLARVAGVLKPVTTSGTCFIGPTVGLSGLAPANGVFLDVFGVQVEQAATPGPYIPTASASVTRAGDVATVDDLSLLRFNAAEGTLFAEGQFDVLDTSTFCGIASLNDGTTANLFRLGKDSINKLSSFCNVGGAVQEQIIPAVTVVAGAGYKLAATYKINSFSCAANGVLGTEDTVATVPAVTRLVVGGTNAGAQLTNAPLRRIRYYPRKLSDAELQALTTL